MNGSLYPLYQDILQNLRQEALTAPLASDDEPAIIDAHTFQMIEVKRLFDVLDTSYSVGAPKEVAFAPQYPARPYPYRRFGPVLSDSPARLWAGVGRYAFTV